MSEGYTDPRVICDDEGIRLRGYYFPWGTKRITYGSIAELRRVNIGAFTGRARIWGTANPRYWANLDPGRMKKKVGFVLDLTRAVRPFVTPDDPDRFELVVRAHTGLEPSSEDPRSGPII
jgi:hypothetical protein